MDKTHDKNLGWTANIILSNGVIKSGDAIIFMTNDGSSNPIQKTTIRNLIGTKYDENKKRFVRNYHNELYASDMITLFAPNLENVIVGTNIYKYENEEMLENLKNIEIQESFITKTLKNKINISGFTLFTSNESEWESGYNVLTSSNIEINNGTYGLLNEKQIDLFDIQIKEMELLEYRIILCYSQSKPNNWNHLVEYAKNKKLTLLYDPVIYKLIEIFNENKDKVIEIRKQYFIKNGIVNMPCELKLLKEFIFMKGGNKQILTGFKIIEGKINIGTEIICYSNSDSKIYNLGKIIKIEKNHKEVNDVKKNDEVCIKLTNPDGLTYLKQFNENDVYYSKQTRQSVDILKRNFKKELNKNDILLLLKQKQKVGF